MGRGKAERVLKELAKKNKECRAFVKRFTIELCDGITW